MQWLRLYAEFATDPKVQMMPESYQRRLVMVFCMRCNVSETFTSNKAALHDAQVAFYLRISPDEWSSTKADFIARGFIDHDNNILKWNKRQYVSDSSTARVYKHREKLKHTPLLETLQKRPETVTVTPPEQNRTDTEQNNKTLMSNEKPFDGSVPPSDEKQPKANEAEKQAVTEVWDYYLGAVERKAIMYELTTLRKRKGLARLRECLRKAGGDYPKAVELMKLCVNAMCASDHHMGRSQSSAGKRYVEWEKHLFATQEQLEKWLMANDEAIA
jgi:hypothetical protein